MSFTGTTPTFGWQIPDQGTQSGVWGTNTLTYMNAVDASVTTIQTTANNALPKAGGTSTGLVNQFTETVKLVAKGSLSGAVTLDLSTAQYFTITHTGAVVYTFSNPPATATAAFPLMIRITNGAAGAITFPAGCKFPSGVQPVWSAGTDLVAFISDDAGTTYRMAGYQMALS
jgi:hypothetical protein